MFNTNSLFGNSNNSNSLDDLQRQYQLQMQQLQQVQQQQQQSRPDGKLQQLNNIVSTMNSEEKDMLIQDTNYIQAKQIYDASFYEFLTNKFAIEFINGEGSAAIDNLITTVNNCKQTIQAKVKSQKDQLNALSQLIKEDPELQKKINEKLNK